MLTASKARNHDAGPLTKLNGGCLMCYDGVAVGSSNRSNGGGGRTGLAVIALVGGLDEEKSSSELLGGQYDVIGWEILEGSRSMKIHLMHYICQCMCSDEREQNITLAPSHFTSID